MNTVYNQQRIFDFTFRQAMGQDDFVLSSANREAVLWLDKWEQWGSPFLVITGEEKSGKTHLCHVWEQMVGAHEIILSGAAYQPEFFATLDGAGFYYIDNVDTLHGLNPQAEQFLFHLYNLLKECGGHCVLASVQTPNQWPLVLKDAQSRLLSCPVAHINPPDESLLEALLMKRFRDKQLLVKYEVFSYIIKNIERSFKALDEIVDVLDSASLQRKRPLTLPLVREALRLGE